MGKTTLAVSVIIPTFNEEAVIHRCLESLAAQTVKPKEVIVVDDGSTDNTFRVVQIATSPSTVAQGPRNDIKIIRQNHEGTGAARNLGASKATGDILVFVDADMRFHPTFLDALTKPIREGKSKGTFSKEEFISNWTNRWARFWNYRKGIFVPRAILADYPNRAPVFRAILKSEFDRVGGFDESRGYDDDWSLSERLGYQATATKAMYYHDNPDTLRDVFLQARWAAKRTYKFGKLGELVQLAKAIPIWATPVFVVRLVACGERLVDSSKERGFGGILFSLVAQTGEVVGLVEHIFGGRLEK